jgi:hypothetical protein
VPETVLFQALFSQRKVSVDACISTENYDIFWCDEAIVLPSNDLRGWDRSLSLSIVFGLSIKTQWLSGLY